MGYPIPPVVAGAIGVLILLVIVFLILGCVIGLYAISRLLRGGP